MASRASQTTTSRLENLWALGLDESSPVVDEIPASHAGNWLGEGEICTSISPASGQAIGHVREATLEDYDLIVKHAEESFRIWREFPAPRRGARLGRGREPDAARLGGPGAPRAGGATDRGAGR